MVKASDVLNAEDISNIKNVCKIFGGKVTAIESYDPEVGPHWIGDNKKSLMQGWVNPNKVKEFNWE